MFRESGIYDYLHRIGFNPLRIGPDIDDKPDVKQDFQKIYVKQFRGILILYSIFILFTIVILCLEILSMSFSYKCYFISAVKQKWARSACSRRGTRRGNFWLRSQARIRRGKNDGLFPRCRTTNGA